MAELSLKQTVSESGISISFDIQHNKKFQSVILYVSFSTKQEKLLSILLRKYAAEKCLVCGLNPNNNIYSAIPGKNSIVLFVPENKITQNISLLYNYLMKTKVSALQSKYIDSYNYSTLAADIKKMSVIITGKCKNFIIAVKNKNGKIERMFESMKIASSIVRENGSGKGEDDTCKFVTPVKEADKNLVALYLSIVLGHIPCEFNVKANEIEVEVACGCLDCVKEIFKFKDVFQGKIKSFLVQTGSVGSPSANDKDGKQWKQKANYILDCENVLASVFSGVRGFDYSFKNVDALKSVDSKAIACVKASSFK